MNNRTVEFYVAAPVAFIAMAFVAIGSAVAGEVSTSDKVVDKGVVESESSHSLIPDWLDIGLTAEAGVTYDDNIFVSNVAEVDDVIYNVSPILTLGVGDTEQKIENYLSFNYRADFEFFQDNTDEDSVEQRSTFDAQYRFTKLVLGLRAFYEDLSGAEIEFGDRVDRTIFSTRLMSIYEVSDRTSFELNGELLNREYDRTSNVDSFEYFGEVWGNYQLLPKISLGGGLTAGAIDVSSGPDQVYYQPLARILYALSEKVSFVLRGGYDIREFDGEGAVDSEDPIFSFVARWQPFDGTKLELNGYQLVRNSAILSGQNITLTGAVLSLQQRFMQKFTFDVRGGYEFSEYTANEEDLEAGREDDYLLFRLGCTYAPNDWLKLLAYYQYRTNDSTVDPVDFDNNQFSVRVQFLF